jgi:hypothetical protein
MEGTKESSVVPFVERMFQLSDTDGDGFLSVVRGYGVFLLYYMVDVSLF